MKTTISFDLDLADKKDVEFFKGLSELVERLSNATLGIVDLDEKEPGEEWKACSMDIICVALATIYMGNCLVKHGNYAGYVYYATFSQLLRRKELSNCLVSTDISSRIAKYMVLCNNLGIKPSMFTAVSEEDTKLKVYVREDSKQTLLKVLEGPLRAEFKEYVRNAGIQIPGFLISELNQVSDSIRAE